MKKQELEMLSEEEAKEIRAFNKKVKIAMAAYAAFCLAAVALFHTVYMFSYVPSGSMEGSIRAGDFLISSRYDVGADELESSFAKGPPDRNNSNDSRFWDNKYVPLENIQAKARRVVFPPSDALNYEVFIWYYFIRINDAANKASE